jgi:diaminopimelate decarboxylase
MDIDDINNIYITVKKIWEDKSPNDDQNVFDTCIKNEDKALMLISAEKYGTPQYLLNQNELIKRANYFKETFKACIPNIDFFYAFKCNDLPFLLKTLKTIGYNADVAGLFECQLASKLGFNKIIFTGPGKDKEELKMAVKKHDKIYLNIDNLEELQRLKDYLSENIINKKIMVSIRINPDPSPTNIWTKFGINLQDLKNIVDIIEKDSRLRLVGLHFHSSFNKSSERYLNKIMLLGEYLKSNLASQVKKLSFIDIGGGFFPENVAFLAKSSQKGELYNLLQDYSETENKKLNLIFDPYSFSIRTVDPLEKFAIDIGKYLEKYILPLNSKLKIFVEPGRYIVTHSTAILVKVVAIKQDCVVVDGGVNLVGDYRFEEYSYAPIINLSNPSLVWRRKIIYGPLCDPSDLWGFSYYGGEIMNGDVLAILHQGAYTYSCSWRFIKPIAQYVALCGKEPLLVKEKETFKERYSGCRF